MDLEALRIFVEVMRRGSFATVARDRGLDASSVSRIIAGLEAELGIRLFQRTTRRLSPTEAGAVYLAQVEPLIAELERAADVASATSATPAGVLRLTTTVSFGQTCVVPLLPEFRARYPQLKLDLLFTDANLDLVADRIDLAIRLGPRLDADLIGAKLFDTRYRVLASPDYLAREGPMRRPEELSERRCVLFPLPLFRTRWQFRDSVGRVTEVPVDGDVMISSALALRQCALAGMGPVLLADWLAGDAITAGQLIDLFPAHEVTATEFETAAWLLYPSRAYLPLKVRATIDFLRERLAGGAFRQSA